MAIFALFAEVTRWKTSCCGTEPSIMVIQAPRKASHCAASASGKKSSLPAADAHLHEVENRHREHAAKRGVGEHDGRAEDHAGALADVAVGDDVEDQPER